MLDNTDARFDLTITSQQSDDTIIPRYEKINILGTGSFGKVYLVSADNQLNVMKVIRNTEGNTAQQEGDILKTLVHPNIIGYQEAFMDSKNRFCLIMEYANGGTLGQYIKAKTQPLAENLIIDWFIQICWALQYIHAQHIVHRDIKSENVFLHDDKIKLGDFGIARSVKETMAKTCIGTPYYISPEIIQNQPYSTKSDIWSLGVLLYELCTYKYPFNAESIHQLSFKIIKGKYQPISAQIYSQNLKQLIQSMLTIDPAKRPSIEQVLEMQFIQNRMLKESGVKLVQQPTKQQQKQQQQVHKPIVIIKKDEYIKQKQERDKLTKQMRDDLNLKRKNNKQKSDDIIIDYFGQPKQPAKVDNTAAKVKKQKDIPIQIYLPYQKQPIQIDTDNKDNQENNNNNQQKQDQPQKQPQVSLEKLEQIRMGLEKILGFDNFMQAYNVVKEQLDKFSLQEFSNMYENQQQQLQLLPINDEKQFKDVLGLIVLLINHEMEYST